jgi:Putative DNA-binding domain
MSITTQDSFARALIDADRAVPDGLTAWNMPRPERRFAVYRNNVASGLARALASRFPATEKIVGDEFFAGMARAFIRRHPPRSPMLLCYGDDFADFVAAFEPAAELPYLPDVIRIEAARGRAYHAADLAPLDPATLAAIAPEQVPSLSFTIHPSVSILRSCHPAVTVWAMNSGEVPLAPLEDWSGEDSLVARPDLTVLVRRLPAGGAAFLGALAAGAELGAAAETALHEAPDFDLTANLTGALQAGAFTAVQ